MPYEFVAELEEIFSGSQAGASKRWFACDFFDKVILAQGSVPLQYWPGGGPARPVPGLPANEVWDGVTALAGHLVVWRDDVVAYSDKNDFTTWIPVGETATTARGTVATPFTQPKPDQVTDWVYIKEADKAYTAGQYVRIELNPLDPSSAVYNFYSVEAVAATAGLSSDTIAVAQTLGTGASRVYTTAQVAWPTGSRLLVNGRVSTLTVTAVSNSNAITLTSSAASDALPLPNGVFSVSVSENPSKLKVGDVLAANGVGQDLFEVVKVGFTLRLKRLNIGTSRHAAGYRFPLGTVFVIQPSISVSNSGASVLVKKSAAITAQTSVKLRALDVTGQSPAGTTIPAKTILATLDANEAGRFVNAGARINGPIFGVVELGEYGFILKRNSIQTLQYVGRENGTFFARGEITEQGPIARHAWARIDDSAIVFCGESEIYKYSGGQNLVPIAQRWTTELFDELDRARADEIVFYHHRNLDQVWMVFPSLKTRSTRVMIYNYSEQSCVIDDYDESLGGITAIGGINWEVAPTWRSLSDTLTWEDDTHRWREYVDEGQQRHTIIAVGGDTAVGGEAGEYGETGVPRLLLHGRKFSRASRDNCAPAAYLCLSETQDYDFGDPRRIKYLDTIAFDIEIRNKLPDRPMNLFIQIGARENLDSDLRWSSPARVEVSGNGNYRTKVNIRAFGRYVRVRFFSEDLNVHWRVAGFSLIGRAGGTF